MKTLRLTIITCLAAAAVTGAQAQRGPRGPQFVSPEIQKDSITFRVLAPGAEEVQLGGSDLPGGAPGEARELTKGEEGVWEITVGPIPAGAYRYNFNVDGVATIDPKNPLTSEANANTWSLVNLPGLEFADTKDVPHGAVAEVTYYSTSLKKFRRMHVYTPPGYENGDERYPVLYLLHGAFDCDDSWTTVGRAGFILDNLIAEGKAKPMVVAMPAGHTGALQFGGPGNALERAVDEFTLDFTTDLRPQMEKRYRLINDRAHRAIAGLSMGGAQTLNIAIPHLQDFAYVGVYSSGVFGINGGPGAGNGETWAERQAKFLKDDKLKEGLELLWFATGKDDFLLETSRATVEMFKEHDFDVVYRETEGAHTWIVWREYLHEFAQELFQ